jgi:hypothetical protein
MLLEDALAFCQQTVDMTDAAGGSLTRPWSLGFCGFVEWQARTSTRTTAPSSIGGLCMSTRCPRLPSLGLLPRPSPHSDLAVSVVGVYRANFVAGCRQAGARPSRRNFIGLVSRKRALCSQAACDLGTPRPSAFLAGSPTTFRLSPTRRVVLSTIRRYPCLSCRPAAASLLADAAIRPIGAVSRYS